MTEAHQAVTLYDSDCYEQSLFFPLINSTVAKPAELLPMECGEMYLV